MKDEGWRMRDAGCEYSITKFSEMWWNDSVFEGSEEHRRCSRKVTDFRLAGVEKLFPWWKDSSLCYASFRMTGLCFLLTIKNLFQWGDFFWIAKIFIIELLFLSELSWRNSFAMKRCGEGWRMRDARCEVRGASILSQSSRRCGEMIAFLRALRNIGDVLGRSRIFGWQV